MERWRLSGAVSLAVGLFVLVQLGALALLAPFEAAGYGEAVDDPSDPTNSLVYVVAILVATAFMLAAIRFDLEWLIRAGIIAASGMLAWFVLVVLAPPVLVVGGVNVLALVCALGIVLGLLVYPEWYVIDAAGVVMGAGAAGLFGLLFGPLPAIVLLVVLAVYDAISVYGTEHMLTLAEGVMEQRIPVVLVVPVTLSYSFLSTESPELDHDSDGDANPGDEIEPNEPAGDGSNGRIDEPTEDIDPIADADAAEIEDDADAAETDDSDGEASELDEDAFGRGALFIGLGDAVIPTVMVASAAFHAPTASLGVPGLALTLPALSAMIGTILGLLVLLWMVLRGRAHAGLPLLNGGAIGGYLVGALASGLSLSTALGL